MVQNKYDFACIISVKNANPNGDPLNGNRPRIDIEGYGEITDVCIKRKIRDRLMENGLPIFVQSDAKKNDDYHSLRQRAEGVLGKETLNSKKTKVKDAIIKACKEWFDVRAFGQLLAFKSDGQSVSVGIRGPVSIHSAFSIEPISITSTQITKSVNGDGDSDKMSQDRMGMKHRVDNAVYVFYGAISPQAAEATGFSDDDAEALKAVLIKLFENDASSARPEGSMAVEKLVWWKHNSKSGQYSSARVHRTLKVNNDATIELDNLDDLTPEVIDGF